MQLTADDAPELWRELAGAASLDAAGREEILASLVRVRSAAHWSLVGPVLLHRARGSARGRVVQALLAWADAGELAASLRYALVGELLGSSGATRAPCAARLARDKYARDVGLALAVAVHVSAARPLTERATLAMRAWCAAGALDPLKGRDGAAVWRAWLDGDEVCEGLDHALLLATSGAPRASVEQLRRVVEHLHALEAAGARAYAGRFAEASRALARAQHARDAGPLAGEGAVALLRWLGRDAASREDVPACAANPGWTRTAACVLARVAIAREGPREALAYVAERCARGVFECALAEAMVRACVLEARRGPGVHAAALDASAECFAQALHDAQAGRGDHAALVRALLGRDEGAGATQVAAPSWLSGHARAELLRVALTHPALGARDAALSDLERGGTMAVLSAELRALARTAPDAITRARARALSLGAAVETSRSASVATGDLPQRPAGAPRVERG